MLWTAAAILAVWMILLVGILWAGARLYDYHDRHDRTRRPGYIHPREEKD